MWFQLGLIKFIGEGKIPVKWKKILVNCYSFRQWVFIFNLFPVKIKYRPVIFPFHRSEKGFPSGIVIVALVRTHSKKNAVPFTVWPQNKICMSCRGYRIGAVGIKMFLGKD